MTEKIEKTTVLSPDKVLSILRNGTSEKIELFNDSIMTGYISEDRIETVINPPSNFVDPFKSRIIGKIKNDNNKTEIHLTIKPSWLTIGFLTIWSGLIIFGVISNNYDNLSQDLKTIATLFIMTLIPFGIARLKVNWDRRRLEKWLEKKIMNCA